MIKKANLITYPIKKKIIRKKILKRGKK